MQIDNNEVAQNFTELIDLLCPVTGNTFKFDQAGQLDRKSVERFERDLERIDIQTLKNFKIRFANSRQMREEKRVNRSCFYDLQRWIRRQLSE